MNILFVLLLIAVGHWIFVPATVGTARVIGGSVYYLVVTALIGLYAFLTSLAQGIN